MNSFKLKSYFTFLGRNKLYAAINLFGFSVSLAIVILLGLYFRGEMSVDKFHPDPENTWMLSHDSGSCFPPPIAADIKSRYPEIEAVTRMGVVWDTKFVSFNGEKIAVKPLCVDSTFFYIFGFRVEEGDPSSLLKTMDEVVLTRSFATKIFGEGQALGKSFTLHDTVSLTVSGVVEDFHDTHLKNPEMILRFEHLECGPLDSYDVCNLRLYVRTVPGSDLSAMISDMFTHFKTYFWLFEENIATEISLTPIADCYFETKCEVMTSETRHSSRQFLWILSAAMLAILLFAVINYINLSVAQAGFRAKEAATRRLLGSSRKSLFAGFIVESVLFCAGAALIALALAVFAAPLFNKLFEAQVEIADIFTPEIIAIAVAAIALLGAVSGIVPALAVSKYRPIEVVRGSFSRKTKMVYSRILITFQYMITIVLLGCAMTIMRQTSFMRTTDLGFDKENLVYLDNKNAAVKPEGYAGLRDKLMTIPGVQQVSFAAGTPLDGGNNNTDGDSYSKPVSWQTFKGDSTYMDILGFRKLRETGIKDQDAYWINEAAIKELGLADTALSFRLYKEECPIAGVFEDFFYRDLTQKIGPTIVCDLNTNFGNRRAWTILVKISGDEQAAVFDKIKEAYSDYIGGVPFESGFVDAELDSRYDTQQRTYTIIGLFALVAIIISALGMLAMATYYMRQRTAEIAIRKVFGSTSAEVLRRIIISFMRMVAIAFVLAVPVIWYLMERWLEDYPYRISLHWSIFAIAGTIAFAVALVSVLWQSVKATKANPTESLRK